MYMMKKKLGSDAASAKEVEISSKANINKEKLNTRFIIESGRFLVCKSITYCILY